MECEVCKKEFVPKRKSARFCSPACRVKYNREVDTPHNSCEPPEEKLGMINGELVAVNQWGEDVKALGPRDLYIRINLYPGVTWKTSPEYAELMKRLKEKSVEELKDQGYFIPAWKEARPSMNKEEK